MAQIDPNQIYKSDDVRTILRIGPKTLGNACTSGRLKFAQQGRERFFRGQWLLDYIDNSVKSNSKQPQPA